MIVPFSALSGRGTYDVVIVGSGPAGLTTAVALHAQGKRVLVLEAGSDDYTPESQDVYRGTVVGDPYFDLDFTRLRQLGGSSNHWGGFCRPLDDFVFEKRLDSEILQWPISKADLDPYIPAAREILALTPEGEDYLVDETYGIRRLFWEFSPPVAFGHLYRDRIETAEGLDLCLGANVTGFDTEDDRVSGLTVQTYDGQTATVHGAVVVLCTGGLENSRLLLQAERMQEGNFLDPRVPLGQYWMEHPHFWVGTVVVPEDFPEDSAFGLTAEQQARLGILNCSLRLGRIRPMERSTIKRVAASIACTAPELGRRLYAAMDRRLICGSALRAAWEQEPRAANRILLSQTETDRFGMPRIELHWTKSTLDRKTIEESFLHFGTYLAETDIGRARLSGWLHRDGDYPEDDELAGHHHMGGTRMADTPALGVVDRNCRTYGRRNLYVGGSSVFSTSGQANPTMTIVQLSLRLADHLSTL
jgi:choline dehydrogenase-like flavoprotein